jgi:glycosyltransferase involved in cell wall biosynthesis
MKKLSILFLTNSYPDFDSSNRAVFIKRLAHLLRKEGYTISVVTPKIFKKSHYYEEQDGIKIYRFPFYAKDKLLIEYQKIPYLRMSLYYIVGFFFSSYVQLKNRCNVIHTHWAIPTGLIGVLLGFLFKRPHVVTVHGSDFRMAMDGSTFIKRIFSLVCEKAKHIICVSELMRREIEQMGIERGRISTLPMGIDETFCQIGKSRGKKLKSQPFTILSNRNLLPIYNVSLLIHAIPIILYHKPKTQFLIAGDGSERVKLEREAKNLEVDSSVNFLGRVSPRKMVDILARSDIYVSTSLYDGASVSLLEAMGSGVFPVVTDIPANREWIIDGINGFLVPIDKAEVLASKILDAICNRDLLEKSRSENLRIVEKKAFWPTNIQRLKGIYSNLFSNVA